MHKKAAKISSRKKKMGRSTRQPQQPPTQLSFAAKRPKDYSKQNLLRKKSIKQELLSSSTRRSAKLNAVMHMDPPGSRRRLGRNPIAEQQQDSSSSPTDVDSANDAVAGGSSSISAECRRSSRKKTIKFDVRDLLNKNRKSHKIQIEARIDSNAPKVGAGQISKAEMDSKQKNFIEKSAIFRRYSISENKLPPRPPPPPGALIHTIQQCVGELEQLPLDGGELNLAAISPIARRLSRTQDILTASMMKPKQVSSLIVTKLESASTSKAAVAASATPARRRVVGRCAPSTSTAIQQKLQNRGRKPKSKVFAESTTETSSSSNDSFELSDSKRIFGEKGKSKEDLDVIGCKVGIIDENSTTCIDLKENLDASAVTLPQPTILDDSMNNSTDDSFVAAEEDLFTSRNHSSDESTTGSIGSSPGGRKVDEISLFGRSNSTETNSSDDSEKRRRKIRITVKRVSLTPQMSPLGSSFGQTAVPIELLSSTNDENSNEDAIQNKRKSTTTPLKGKQVEKCATPPIILLESDTSNAASIGSSVIEITSSLGTPIEEPELSPNTRRGRSCKLIEEVCPKTTTHDMNFQPVQKSTAPQNMEVSLSIRSSSRKSAPHLPIETIAASSPSTSLKDDAQSIKNIISPKEDDMVRVDGDFICNDSSLSQNQKVSSISVKVNQKATEEIFEQSSEYSEEKIAPQVRSLRSAQSVQVKPQTQAVSKKQRKSNKAQAATETPSEDDTHTQLEVSDKEVLPMSSKDGQFESVQNQEFSLPDEKQSPSSKGLQTLHSLQSQTGVKQSLRQRKDIVCETENKPSSESDKQEIVVLSKQTRSRGLKVQAKLDDPNPIEYQIGAKEPTSLSEVEEVLKTEEKTNHAVVEEDETKSERESTIDNSTDGSSTDTTTSDRRRESLRSRSSVLPTKKQTSKKISKVIATSGTPDSSSEGSECNEKSPKNRRQIMSANVIDNKSKEETSSLCSESSSNAASTSSSSSSSGSSSTNSSSSSSSTSSSSSNSSSSSSSSSSEGRSTRSSRNTQKVSLGQQPKVKKIRSKSQINKIQSNKSDSDSSENFPKTDSIKGKYNDIKFNELEKLIERRKSARLERSSSEPDIDTEKSESSFAIQHKSKTRSGRSRGRVERKAKEIRQKLPNKPLHQDLGASGVEVDKIATEKSSNDTTNQETKTEAPKSETSITPRAKSKKRTRRFVPIKYSSSESGTLSDDGNDSSKTSSVRLTRTRRKTISSASEFEEMPSDNLSPPDLALEYLPRKSKQAEVKTQQLTEKKVEGLIKPSKGESPSPPLPPTKDSKIEKNIICKSKTEEESTLGARSKDLKSRKGIRNTSDISKESESDQSSKGTGSKQEAQQSVPSSSPSSPGSSGAEGLVDVLRQRKITRLSLKTQASDPRYNESQSKSKDLGTSLDTKESIVKTLERGAIEQFPHKSSECKNSQLECDLKDDKGNKSAIQVLQDVSKEDPLQNKDFSSSSNDVLDSIVVSQLKSPKQRKFTKLSEKSPVSLRSKQEYTEKLTEQNDEETDKPKECHYDEKASQNRSREAQDDDKTSQICSNKTVPLKNNFEKSDIVSSPEINPSHENLPEKDKNDDLLQEVVQVEENKEDDNLNTAEQARFSGTRKGTRLSLKKMETTSSNSEKRNKERSENDEKKTEADSIPLDVLKSDQVVKSPRQRKPTRFSPKGPEELKLDEGQQTEEDSRKNEETDVQKEPDLASPRIRKTTRLSPKSLNLKDIEVIPQEEYQSVEHNVDAPTEDSQLKSDSETAMIGPLKSRILEKSPDPEPFNNSLSEALKLPETPKRKRKPTRFSPKSPDKPTIGADQNLVGSEAILKALSDEKIEEVPIDRIDEVKKTEEPSNISKSPVVLPTEGLVKSPRVRKGTRFAPKSPDNLQIQQELPLTKESQSPIDVENKEENPSVLENRDVSNSSLEEIQLKEPAKLTRARKGTRVLGKSSENLQIEEELKKMLLDSQSEMNLLFEKHDVYSSSSSETKQSRLKKETRFSLQAATKVESQTKKAPEEFEDNSTRNSRQKQKTGENESFADVKGPLPIGISIIPTTSCNQTHLFTGNYSEQISHDHPPEQTSQKSSQDAAGSSNLAPIKQPVGQEDAIKCLEIETKTRPELADLNVSVPSAPSSPPAFKPELTSKKGLKKQLQSMLDSLTPENKVSQKETTPRRKRKTLEQQQESIIPAQDSPITKKADEPNREVDMKVLSSDSNLSDDSIKPQEGSTQIDQKHAPRRQLDSSFIKSLEKSLLRPISGKKSSKKKEKDKETNVGSSPNPPKEESKKTTTKKPQEPCEELKKPESSSPKLKKKQSKESPKMVKKHSEEQTTSKRKSMVAAKAKELEETKPFEPDSSLSDFLNDDPMTKQSSEVLASPVVNTQIPKTKAETKFFSPEKPFIQNESLPLIATVEQPVAPVVIVKEKSPDLLPDPLKDIEKFIEDGVNLLKRCYKIDADDDDSLDRDILKPDEMMTPKKCKLDESVAERKPEEGTPPHDDNSNSNSESSTITTNTSVSEVDTPNGIRRSHRIKNNSKSTKCLVGRGLVRERERFSTKDDEKTIYSIDDQKMDLAEVEAKNSKFLKDMEERLSNFRVIRENEYKCERVISKEAKRMLCDCFLTHEEEERGELGCGEDCLNRLLMIECGGDCTVRERCTNRRFNKFLYSPCRVFRTEKKGFGIMADIEILPGEFIMEYVGEVINGDEFEIRINEYSKDKNKHYYFMALRSDAVIDATAKGNISRFINHSCDPNAETQKWTVNGELRIGFFSRKSIMPGEEITFDYQYQRYGKEAQRCYCESSNCRGWIGAEPSSEEEEYEGVDEDESEETEEEEPAGAVIPVPVIPITTPPIVVVANVEEQPVVPVVTTEVPAIDVNIVTQPQPVAVPTPLVEPIPAEVIEKPKELPLKKKKEKKRLLEEKLKRREPKQFLEDPDIEDEVRFLVKCGLRNQADTLRLSRLIVRAKLLETRINLLQILRQGELPCRRLFLDYHGLRLLHGWMSEVIDTRDTEKSMEIRMELLSALECLPISNKTMLTDSKVYQTVRDWSNNKESHSPSDGSPKEANTNSSSASPTLAAPAPIIEDASSELQKLAAKLVHTWDNLPEVFRIPKRERIEQMKEHEREADRQYKVLGKGLMSGSDRNRNRERFMSKSGQKGRFNWSKDKERDRANERRKYAQNNNSSGKDGTDKSTGPLAGESHLSKEQRRELFAAKVARDEAEKRQAEERREFDIKCRFFGLDPKRMRPENMPFCVNPSTGQWYSTDKKAISTPPSYAHVQVPVKPKSTNPTDYRLPEMDLPPLWKFAISPKGKIYYYHVKIRIPQWEPPIKILPLAGQHNTVVKNSESDSSTAGINDSSEDDIEVIKGLDPVKLQAYIEKKIEDRRLQRYNRLVGEKPISPRKEEDRIYNQMEVRKYKENKEKIRKRKEEIRKRRDIIGKQGGDSSNLSETTEVAESVAEALPIQDYLLSSEEEEIIKAECNNSPLIDKIVQGDKIVDELDALHKKRSLKRALPIRDKYEHKKRKLDKNKDSSKSTKRNKDGEGSSSSSKYRKVREKFRCEIAGIIVQHLKPYRNESCITGKILTDDDFNHLARKLTHFVMVKELKYCESIGQTLIVTESVKNKSREFIKKYMAKYGKVYVRPKNDPEFKDIPFL